MLTGIVLAGGRSSRMGQDKAWLPVGRQTLIELVLERVRPSVDRLMVVAQAPGDPRLHDLPVDAVVTDLAPHRGPLMGLYTGLMRADTSLTLCCPCDMPWLEGRLIGRLLDQLREDVELVACRHPVDGLQPFPLLCRVTACRTAGTLLDRGERSLQALVRASSARILPVEDPTLWRSFTNVNTVEDYAELCNQVAFVSRS